MPTPITKPTEAEQSILHELNAELACIIVLLTDAIQNGYEVMSTFEYAGPAPTVGEDISSRKERVNYLFSKLKGLKDD